MAYPVIPVQPPLVQGDPLVATQKANVLPANTPPTLALDGEVVALSPANTGLPVNTPVIVQKAKAVSTGSVASIAAAFTNNNVAGNSIVVLTGAGDNGALTVTDSAGNTYKKAILQANSTTFQAAIYYSTGIVAGANTVTVADASSDSMAIQIYEVSGLIAQEPLGQSTSGTGTSATPTLSALASSTPNALAFLAIAVGTAAQAVSATTTTNWTLDSTQNSGATVAGLYTFGALSQYLGNISPVVPTATVASSEPYAACAAIFKPVVVGVQGVVTIGGYNYSRMTSAATLLVKTGAGVLHAITINTPVASGTIEMDDALTNTTPIIGKITLPGTLLSDGPKNAIYDVAFSTGLSITTTGTMDITIAWK
jgi:hypothetical protein